MTASSPPKLLVNSSHTMEEMCVITIDFLAKLNIVTSEDLRVNIEVRVVMIYTLDNPFPPRCKRETHLKCGI